MPGRTGRQPAAGGRRKGGRTETERTKQEINRDSSVRGSRYQGPRARQAGYGETRETYGMAGQAELLQKYLEPDRNREREIQKRKKEIMAAKARKEKYRKELKETAAGRVSYVKKPFAVRSKMAALLTAASLALGGSGMYAAVTTQGGATLTHGAMGFCSIVLAVAALWYGGISFLEDDKNYILAKLAIPVSVLLLAAWAVVIVMGLQ